MVERNKTHDEKRPLSGNKNPETQRQSQKQDDRMPGNQPDHERNRQSSNPQNR